MSRFAFPPSAPSILAALAALAALAGRVASQAPAIAFISARVGHAGLYVVNADGTGLTRLTTHEDDRAPRWSPDGRRIAFATVPSRVDGADLINEGPDFKSWPYFVMDADGKNTKPLLTTPAYQLQWSPDGRSIAFMSGFEDPENERPEIGYNSSAIYVVEPGGNREPRRITPIEGHDGPFAWSRDGSRLLYMANRTNGFRDEGDWDVCVMNADGSAKANLTANPARDTAPVWSADEQRIVFRSDRDGKGRLYSMDASGGDVVPLPVVTPWDTPLFCTPDGRIVFSAATDVWVMGLDGKDPRKIASVDTGFAALREGDVVLSPDGKTIAYVTRAGVFTVPVAGGQSKQITEGGGAFHLAWSPAAH